MNNCPFCNIKQEEIVFANDLSLFIQQRDQDVLIGSGLIIPKTHRENVFDLSIEEWQASYEILQRAKIYIDEIYRPDGYNVGWNIGRVGGQEVFHAHMHVIPRYGDEPLAGKGIRFWFKQPENKRPENIIGCILKARDENKERMNADQPTIHGSTVE